MINKTKVYVDGVDAQHEIGEASGGSKIYTSIKDLKSDNPCWKECGIVEAEISFVKWIEEQNFDNLVKSSSLDKTEKELQLEHLNMIKEYHEKQFLNIKKRIKEIK